MVRDPMTYRGRRRNVAREVAAQLLNTGGRTQQPTFLSRMGTRVGAGIALVSALLSFLVLFPRVTVEGLGQIDPEHPNPTFVIGNATIIPLTNVRPTLAPCALLFRDGPGLIGPCDGYSATVLQSANWAVHKITMDEKHAIQLSDVVKNMTALRSADLIITVTFNPWFIPVDRVKAFRFKTRLESDGKMSWLPEGMEK